MSNQVSYYSNLFLEKAGHHIISDLPLENADGLRPDLDVNEQIQAAFFKLGSQDFTTQIEPTAKTARYVKGDIQTDSGLPVGFTVGYALLCLYASNYTASTRQHLVQALGDFLKDDGNGQPRIKEMALNQYMDIVRIQTTLKLPQNTLTQFIGNSEQLENEMKEKYSIADIAERYRNTDTIVHVQASDNGKPDIRVSKKHLNLITGQLGLFDDEHNKAVNERFDKQQVVEKGLVDFNINIEQGQQDNINQQDIMQSMLDAFKTKFKVDNAPQVIEKTETPNIDHQVSNEEITTIADQIQQAASQQNFNNPVTETIIPTESQILQEELGEDHVVIEAEVPNNQTAVNNKYIDPNNINIENTQHHINTIRTQFDTIEAQSALLNVSSMLINSIANNNETIREKAVDSLILVTDAFANITPNVDFTQLKKEVLSIQGLEKPIIDRINDGFSALNWKHNPTISNNVLVVPKYEQLVEEKNLMYFNVLLDNNRLNMLALRPIKDNKKTAIVYDIYANNGALDLYLDKNPVINDYNNSFSAKISASGALVISTLSGIAQYVSNEKTMDKIIDKLYSGYESTEELAELKRLMAVMNSKQEMLIGNVPQPANLVFGDKLLEQIEDIVSNAELNQQNPIEYLTIAIQGACLNAHSKEEKIMIGQTLRKVQHLADDNKIPQDFVDNAYRDISSVLSGAALAHIVTNDEINKYDLQLTKNQINERNRIIKNEADAERKALKKAQKKLK